MEADDRPKLPRVLRRMRFCHYYCEVRARQAPSLKVSTRDWLQCVCAIQAVDAGGNSCLGLLLGDKQE